jgi:ADP-heptose:LPS heptosyltransferase
MGWPAKLSAVLYQQGFDEVLNLLEAFNSLRLDDRWTPGPWGSPHEHVIDAMATFLHHRGIEVPAARRKPVLPVLSHHPRAARSIVLNPNAGSSLKEAPVDLWVNLATGLASRGHVPLVLKGQGGGSSESICRHASRARPISTPGLPALTHLLSSADLLISPDTGVLHLAAALGVPYIGLFGSTDPRFLGPYGADPRDILLSRAPHERVCRGCWTAQLLPRANCALGYTPSCLSWLQPRDLLTRIDEKLDATPVGAKP